MAWRLNDNGSVSYACPSCGSFDTSFTKQLLVTDNIEDSSRLAPYKKHSTHAYECNECFREFYIDENQRELIDERKRDGFTGEDDN